MLYWIFPESVIPISRSTVQRVTPAELETDLMKQQCGTFDKAIQNKFRGDFILEQGELLTLEQHHEFVED